MHRAGHAGAAAAPRRLRPARPAAGVRSGTTARLRVRVPAGWGRATRVWLRSIQDGEPRYEPCTDVGEADGWVWWEAPMTVTNPVARYRFLLEVPVGQAGPTAVPAPPGGAPGAHGAIRRGWRRAALLEPERAGPVQPGRLRLRGLPPDHVPGSAAVAPPGHDVPDLPGPLCPLRGRAGGVSAGPSRHRQPCPGPCRPGLGRAVQLGHHAGGGLRPADPVPVLRRGPRRHHRKARPHPAARRGRSLPDAVLPGALQPPL